MTHAIDQTPGEQCRCGAGRLSRNDASLLQGAEPGAEVLEGHGERHE